MSRTENLRVSAGSGLVWGVGSTLVRDGIQFAAMLVLVRLLSPEVYGQAALAQTIVAFLAVVSFKSVAPFALQARDPAGFDWSTHFSVGARLNLGIFAATLGLGAGLAMVGGETFGPIGVVLLAMSPVFLVEIGGTYRLVWLQAHHRWRRLRLLVLAGALLSVGSAILIAALGGGVFALAVASWTLGVPFVIDLACSRERPRLTSAPLRRYREGWRFGLNRAASGALSGGSALTEQSLLSAMFGFGMLGVYTRAIGLAQITSGRIGPVVTQSLYSVLTRAEACSARFRRFAATLYQGVVWVSVPTAAFLAIEAEPAVALLFGPQWESVAPLLPLACALLALRGIATTLYQILLANLQQGACLKIDVASALLMFPVIVVAISFGVGPLLLGLIAHSATAVLVLGAVAVRGGALDAHALLGLALPAVCATAGAASAVLLMPGLAAGETGMSTAAYLLADATVFGAVYLALLRLLAAGALGELLGALPLGVRLRRLIDALLLVPPKRRATVSVPE